jgi:hypothetical protein
MCCRSPYNFQYVLSSRIRDTNVLSGSIIVEKLQRLGKPKVWIPCSHVIVVCQHRNFDVYGFIDERYNTAHLLNTWSGQFYCYGDQQVWPPYLGETIIPNKVLVCNNLEANNTINLLYKALFMN